jgi:hypothetical protein
VGVPLRASGAEPAASTGAAPPSARVAELASIPPGVAASRALPAPSAWAPPPAPANAPLPLVAEASRAAPASGESPGTASCAAAARVAPSSPARLAAPPSGSAPAAAASPPRATSYPMRPHASVEPRRASNRGHRDREPPGGAPQRWTERVTVPRTSATRRGLTRAVPTLNAAGTSRRRPVEPPASGEGAHHPTLRVGRICRRAREPGLRAPLVRSALRRTTRPDTRGRGPRALARPRPGR